MKSLMTLAAAVCLIGLTSAANAGYLAVDATITRIESTTGNQQSFVLTIQGGSGPCTGTFAVFPVSASPDADTHKRSYAAAMMAFAMGMRVSIFNYANDSCSGASYISIYP
jgi:hypothetical protein